MGRGMKKNNLIDKDHDAIHNLCDDFDAIGNPIILLAYKTLLC